MNDRAQVYTLEGIISALVVMAGLLFALQATTASPGAVGVTNPQAQQQDDSLARDVLVSADEEDLLTAALFWNASEDEFHCSPGSQPYYPASGAVEVSSTSGVDNDCPASGDHRATYAPPNDFGKLLDNQFGSGYSYNVWVAYNTSSTGFERQRMIYQGQPGEGVVRASRSVVVTDNQTLYDAAGGSTSDMLDDSSFYASDTSSGRELFNVLYVEVVAWRG